MAEVMKEGNFDNKHLASPPTWFFVVRWTVSMSEKRTLTPHTCSPHSQRCVWLHFPSPGGVEETRERVPKLGEHSGKVAGDLITANAQSTFPRFGKQLTLPASCADVKRQRLTFAIPPPSLALVVTPLRWDFPMNAARPRTESGRLRVWEAA